MFEKIMIRNNKDFDGDCVDLRNLTVPVKLLEYWDLPKIELLMPVVKVLSLIHDIGVITHNIKTGKYEITHDIGMIINSKGNLYLMKYGLTQTKVLTLAPTATYAKEITISYDEFNKVESWEAILEIIV